MKEKLLWIDVETTGLNPDEGYLLEIAVALTDENVDLIKQVSHVVNWAHKEFTVREAMSPVVLEMHEKNGLLEKVFMTNLHWPDLAELDQFLTLDVIHWDTTADYWKPLRIAGSKPAFDRKWIEKHLPNFARLPHYRDFDISTVRSLLRVPESKEPSTHRAGDDIDRDIKDLRRVLDAIPDELYEHFQIDA